MAAFPGRIAVSPRNSAAPSTDDPPAADDGLPAAAGHGDGDANGKASAGERSAPSAPQQRLLYGRRQGPRLRPGRRRALDEILPTLRLTLPGPGLELDTPALFGDARPLWLEIGFGGGEHLAAQAAAHPDVGLLGVEPFLNGVARLLTLLSTGGPGGEALGNVRILVDDARLLLAVLPTASIERAFVLFPDPWPKLRHHKRRIVNAATVAALARVLRPGGELRLATDDAAYARWMLEVAQGEPALVWLAESALDWGERPADWPPTRYEAKALAAGRRPVYLRFRHRD